MKTRIRNGRIPKKKPELRAKHELEVLAKRIRRERRGGGHQKQTAKWLL